MSQRALPDPSSESESKLARARLPGTTGPKKTLTGCPKRVPKCDNKGEVGGDGPGAGLGGAGEPRGGGQELIRPWHGHC